MYCEKSYINKCELNWMLTTGYCNSHREISRGQRRDFRVLTSSLSFFGQARSYQNTSTILNWINLNQSISVWASLMLVFNATYFVWSALPRSNMNVPAHWLTHSCFLIRHRSFIWHFCVSGPTGGNTEVTSHSLTMLQ